MHSDERSKMAAAKRDAWSDVSLVPVRRCAVCGKPFTACSKTARYCSESCRNVRKMERNREWRERHPKAVEQPHKNAKIDSYCPFRGDVADKINRMRNEIGR